MQYIIDDTPIIEADVLVKQPPLISSEVLVPIKTISHEEEPTVSPLQIVDYGSSSIECAFDVTTQEAEEVVKGVLCGTTNPPTFENADYRLLHGQGSMDLAFAGLHINTEYYLRPYALSNLGYKYGDVVAQRTKISPIPNEYQLVEYLASTGTQYIHTGKLYTQYDSVELETAVTAIPSSWACLFGTGDNYAAGSGAYLITYNSNMRRFSGRIGNVNVYGNELIFNDFKKYKLVGGDSIYYYYEDDILMGSNTISPVGSRYAAILFGCNWGTPQQFTFQKMKHFLRRNIDGTILENYYPVYRRVDSKPGMYDIVENKFYTNSGYGEFIVGPDREWQ